MSYATVTNENTQNWSDKGWTKRSLNICSMVQVLMKDLVFYASNCVLIELSTACVHSFSYNSSLYIHSMGLLSHTERYCIAKHQDYLSIKTLILLSTANKHINLHEKRNILHKLALTYEFIIWVIKLNC